MVSSSRSPTRLGCRLREQRERKRRTVAVAQWYASPWERAGRCLHTGYVIQKARERRVLCNEEFGGRRRLPSGFPLGGGRLKQARSAFCSAGWMDGRGEGDTLMILNVQGRDGNGGVECCRRRSSKETERREGGTHDHVVIEPRWRRNAYSPSYPASLVAERGP